MMYCLTVYKIIMLSPRLSLIIIVLLQKLSESELAQLEKMKSQNEKLFKTLHETAKSNEPIWKVKYPDEKLRK